MKHLLLMSGLALVGAGCSTLSPKVEIKDRFVEFGVSEERATCLADELDQRLDRNDLQDVANYVAGLNAADSAGAALDALLNIENPRATSAIAAAGLSCAFSS